ncbi:MAG: c-type cytochrome [Alphaproteobacteria bacterium]
MNSFEFNKIAGAFLMSLLIITVIGHIGNFIIPKPVVSHEDAGREVNAEAQTAAAPAAPAEPIAELLKTASAEEGAKIFKTKCTSCHNSDKGGANKVGPNLWNIVGDAKADPALGFNFSDAMKNKGGTWTYDDLSAFLTNPKGFVPGTRMTFVGLKKDEERANVIAFLRAQADSPKPLP